MTDRSPHATPADRGRVDAPLWPVSFPDTQLVPDEHGYGELQSLLDALFLARARATNLDLVTQAEIHDVERDALEVVGLLPSGSYTRRQMADQLNSIITAHGWGSLLGTVS